MTTTHEVIRAAIPGASDEVCEHVLWERTPFPCSSVTARRLYRAADGAARAAKNGIELCGCCHRVAEAGQLLCRRCGE